MNQIRPIALCVFRKNNRILVFEGYDPSEKKTFYRPLGGGIDFGERSEDTVRREIREEINAEVGELHFLGTLENIFSFDGKLGHEIVQIYDGMLEESGLYEQAVIIALKGSSTSASCPMITACSYNPDSSNIPS